MEEERKPNVRQAANLEEGPRIARPIAGVRDIDFGG